MNKFYLCKDKKAVTIRETGLFRFNITNYMLLTYAVNNENKIWDFFNAANIIFTTGISACIRTSFAYKKV